NYHRVDSGLSYYHHRHLTCVAKWLGHKNTETIGSVHTQLSTQHKLEVEANKSYIKTLIDITLYLSCQGLPFRGHDESTDSLNEGNFKESCQLMSKYVPEFSVKFLQTTNYTSSLVQNSIIEMCAKNVRDQIISEVRDGVFGLMCDEARCCKEEQMVLCIRYCKGLDIVEKFIGFINCSEIQNAHSLCEYILKYSKECGLNLNAKLVARCRCRCLKTATLGNAANVIKSVIKSFEDLKSPVAFSQMWKIILQFCEDHDLTIEKLMQNNKRKRLQPKNLSSYV
ncbi:zinc finger MYM-type protein 1-like, partial [Aphis craccivora]